MIKRALCALAVSVLLVGCRGTVQVGIERTPTPNSALTATLESLVEENQRLATQVAAQAASSPLSPDLGQLAYVQGGDIWFTDLSAEPSQPRRLTSDGHNLEPRWSPSGRWLAFRKERALASSAFPVATPGYSIAVLQRQVWLIQADGNGEHPLNLGSSVEAFAWSPTDDRLAYTTAAGGLSIIGADGTNPVTLVSDSL